MMCYAGDTSCASDANIIHATSRKHYENQLASFRRPLGCCARMLQAEPVAVAVAEQQQQWQGRAELAVQKGWAACSIDRSN